MCTVIIWTKEKLYVKFSHTPKVILYDSAYGKHMEHVRKFAAQAGFLLLGLNINLPIKIQSVHQSSTESNQALCYDVFGTRLLFLNFSQNAGAVPGEQCWVPQRRGDGQVTVNGNHAQRLYARCHAQHVGRRPECTHEISKLPDSQQDVTGAEGHHHQAHDEVGNGQRGDEEVGDGLQSLETQDGGNHQHVTWAEEEVFETLERFGCRVIFQSFTNKSSARPTNETFQTHQKR